MNNLISSKPRILIVEDENIVALDIERGLTRLGYEVIDSVNNGKEAIEKAEALKPDLILMDIQIQGDIDGIDTANIIRKISDTPIVFLTAYADEATLQRAKAVGPYGYLLKPFDETELHTAIEVILQKHYVFEQQQATSRAALILSEKRFKLFLESLEDYALFMLDPSGNVISWSSGAERIKGYTAEEILGKHFSIFYPTEELNNQLPKVQLEKTIQEGRYEGESWRIRKDGTRYWANVVMTALRDEKGNLQGFGKLVHDLTTKKEAENKLKLAIEERDHALQYLKEIIQVRDEFMSIASHELKTPLTSILLQLQLLQRKLNQNEPHPSTPDRASIRNSIALCEMQCKNLADLVNKLFDLTQIRLNQLNLDRQEVDLVKVTKETVTRLIHTSTPEIIFDPSEKIIGLWDRSRIEQVITNLISNAVKYGEGKPIRVSFCVDSKRQAKIIIKDQGKGIPTEFHSKIFERFERMNHSSNNGLGLGLYISHRIVKAHGGEISLHSEVGKGSIFNVILPLAQ